MKHTLSKYNKFFTRGGRYFLFNALSNSFAELDKETYFDVCAVVAGRKSVDGLDPDLLDDLRKMQSMDADEDTELLKLKLYHQSRKFDRNSLILTINPTLSCNFACPYCFEHEHPAVYMTDEAEDEIVKFVASKNVSTLRVTWFGGEPLLGFRRILSLTPRLQEIVPDYSGGMISNGYLLTKEVIEQLTALKIKSIQITIDGIGENHDSKRCLKDGSPTFDRIIKNIRECRAFAPEVRIAVRVNLDRNNTDDFIKVCDYFKSSGIEGVDITPGFIVDRGEENTSCSLAHKEIVKFAVDTYGSKGIQAVQFYPSLNRGECSACQANAMVIGPEGELYKCWEEVGRKDCIIGYLDGRKGNEVHHLRYLVGVDKFSDSECLECELLPLCDGGCPRVRILNKYEGKEIDRCCFYKAGLEDLLYLHAINKENSLAQNERLL